MRVTSHDPNISAPLSKPCKECVWRRDSVPGEFLPDQGQNIAKAVHGRLTVLCHCAPDRQCTGAAIYRGNIAKTNLRHPNAVVLGPDTSIVFASKEEFLAHHAKIPTGPNA